MRCDGRAGRWGRRINKRRWVRRRWVRQVPGSDKCPFRTRDRTAEMEMKIRVLFSLRWPSSSFFCFKRSHFLELWPRIHEGFIWFVSSYRATNPFEILFEPLLETSRDKAQMTIYHTQVDLSKAASRPHRSSWYVWTFLTRKLESLDLRQFLFSAFPLKVI